jgi:sulfate permease, SulP family
MLAECGIVFALARVKSDLRVVLEPTGFIERIGEDRVFMTLPTPVSAYQQWYAARRAWKPDDDLSSEVLSWARSSPP